MPFADLDSAFSEDDVLCDIRPMTEGKYNTHWYLT